MTTSPVDVVSMACVNRGVKSEKRRTGAIKNESIHPHRTIRITLFFGVVEGRPASVPNGTSIVMTDEDNRFPRSLSKNFLSKSKVSRRLFDAPPLVMIEPQGVKKN